MRSRIARFWVAEVAFGRVVEDVVVAVGFGVVNVDRGNVKGRRCRCGLGRAARAEKGNCERCSGEGQKVSVNGHRARLFSEVKR